MHETVFAGQTVAKHKADHVRCVRLLLEKRADPDARDVAGHTALDVAKGSTSLYASAAALVITAWRVASCVPDGWEDLIRGMSLN